MSPSIHVRSAPGRTASLSPLRPSRWGWLEAFVIAQTAVPALLFFPGTQGVRTSLRVLPYLMALAPLALVLLSGRRGSYRHPAVPVLVMVLLLLVPLLAFGPGAGGSTAGPVAQLTLIAAVLAPAFWVPRFVQDDRQFRRLLWIMLVTNGVNSFVGVMQAYDPERWMPAQISAMIDDVGKYTYEGAQGRLLIRPCGLFDTPGAVSGPGAWSVILGLCLSMQERTRGRRGIALGFAFLGMAAIYLTLVRTAFVVAAIAIAAYLLVISQRERLERSAIQLVIAVAVAATGMMAAAAFGGDAVRERFGTLFETPPDDLYYGSRGAMLEEALSKDLFNYPFGDGLGRWGMVPVHFGGGGHFAEIQIHGWIIDGGIMLVLLYVTAICIALRHDLTLALRSRERQIYQAATTVFAMNLGVAAMIFTFVPFHTQIGIQFWLMTAALGAAAHRRFDGAAS